MPIPRFRIRTLMIAVAVVGIALALIAWWFHSHPDYGILIYGYDVF